MGQGIFRGELEKFKRKMQSLRCLIALVAIWLVRGVTNNPTNYVISNDRNVVGNQPVESSLQGGYITTNMHNDAVKRVIDDVKSRQSDQHIGNS